MSNDAMIDFEVDVNYCIPDITADAVSEDPYILLTYSEDQYTTRTRKVSLGKVALQSSPEDLAKHILLSIENFKEEADDIRMG
ncbi:MAG: hypothetical protein Q9M40_09235 [Sulfurimonas sp.]|nr:hypothetical protein [Sulfurimonas sp.]